MGDGFSAPDLPADVKTKLNTATAQVFGEGVEPTYIGVGGTIPFMEIFMKENLKMVHKIYQGNFLEV